MSNFNFNVILMQKCKAIKSVLRKYSKLISE